MPGKAKSAMSMFMDLVEKYQIPSEDYSPVLNQWGLERIQESGERTRKMREMLKGGVKSR